MKDNYDDELMKLAGELLAEKRSERFDRLNAAERAYSPRFRKRWKGLLCRTRAGRNGRAVSGRNLLRVTAVTAAAVILMTAAAAVPVIPVIRETFFRTRAAADPDGITERSVQIDLQVNEDTPFADTDGMPAYIPEGYTLARTNEQPEYGLLSATWRPGPEHDVYHPGGTPIWTPVVFNRWLFDPEDPHTGSAAGDGYRSVISTSVPLGPYEGQLVRTVWNLGTVDSTLFWTDSRYVYMLDACTEIVPGSSEDGVIRPLPLEDLLLMARSVSEDPDAADRSEISAFAAEWERQNEHAAGGLCPECGMAELRAVCTHDPLRGYEEQLITGHGVCGDPEHGEGCHARRTFCWTDYACPECGYLAPGTEQHAETAIHTLSDGTEFTQALCGLPSGEKP